MNKQLTCLRLSIYDIELDVIFSFSVHNYIVNVVLSLHQQFSDNQNLITVGY